MAEKQSSQIHGKGFCGYFWLGNPPLTHKACEGKGVQICSPLAGQKRYLYKPLLAKEYAKGLKWGGGEGG